MGPDPSGQPSPEDQAPSGIAISWEPGAKGATLRWTPADNPSIQGYLIYRTASQPQTAVRDYKRLSTDVLSAPSFQDVELPNADQWFYYQVVSLLEGGKEGPPSRSARICGNVQFIPNALGRRAELVFVDGQLLRQVNTQSEMAVGRYCVDGSDPGIPRLFIQLSPRQNIANAIIEVSGQNAFLPNLAINAKNNLVIRKIRFQHAGVRAWNFGGINISGGKNILIEDNEFSYNNSDGIHCGGMDDFTFRRNRCVANGGGGFGGTGRTNWLFEDNECSSNGWRATTLGGQAQWFHAGIKTGFGLRNAIFRNNRMTANACIGFWLDTDMENVLIDKLMCTDNQRDGMWWEAALGPGMVTNSRFERNQGYGLRIADAGGLTLDGNTISDNSRAQICIAMSWYQEQAGRPVKNRVTGETAFGGARPNTWTRNTIAALRADQMIVAFEWGSLPSYQAFLKNLSASGNTYWHPTTPRAFMSPLAGSLIKLDLDQWSKITGAGKPQDTGASGTRWQQSAPTSIDVD